MESPFKAEILKGKVALITGGGSGIGFEISAQFGKHGASIAIMGRRKQVLDSAVSALRSLGIPVLSLFPSYIVSSNFAFSLQISLE
jgi:peroxisomal 2,4-dienoyl-CoA reductase